MDHASDNSSSIARHERHAGDSSQQMQSGDRGHTDRQADWTSRFLRERPMAGASSRYSGGEGRAGGIPLD